MGDTQLDTTDQLPLARRLAVYAQRAALPDSQLWMIKHGEKHAGEYDRLYWGTTHVPNHRKDLRPSDVQLMYDRVTYLNVRAAAHYAGLFLDAVHD